MIKQINKRKNNFLCYFFLVFTLLLANSTQGAEKKVLNNFAFKQVSTQEEQVTLQLSQVIEPVIYTLYNLPAKPRLVIDLARVGRDKKITGNKDVNGKMIKRIRVGTPDGKKTRIVFDLTSDKIKYDKTVDQANNTITINVYSNDKTIKQKEKDTEITDEKKEEVNNKDTKIADEKKEEVNNKDTKIADKKKEEVNNKDTKVAGKKKEEVNNKDTKIADKKKEEVNNKEEKVKTNNIITAQKRKKVVQQAPAATKEQKKTEPAGSKKEDNKKTLDKKKVEGKEGSKDNKKKSPFSPAFKEIEVIEPTGKTDGNNKVPTSTVQAERTANGTLYSINFDGDNPKGELVKFQLSGFLAPTVIAVEKENPKVVCEFDDIVLDEEIRDIIPGKSKFVRQIKVAPQKGVNKVRVTIELSPNKHYNLQQIFFKQDNLFVLVINEMDNDFIE